MLREIARIHLIAFFTLALGIGAKHGIVRRERRIA